MLKKKIKHTENRTCTPLNLYIIFFLGGTVSTKEVSATAKRKRKEQRINLLVLLCHKHIPIFCKMLVKTSNDLNEWRDMQCY